MLGNSEAVAPEHYLRVRDEDFTQALGLYSATHETTQTMPEQSGMNRTILDSKKPSVLSTPSNSDVVHSSCEQYYTPEDSNTPKKQRENVDSRGSGAQTGAPSRETTDLAYLRERWPDAPEGVLLDALAILNNASVNQ